MKLHFLGANRQVTGSCYCLETDQAKLLVDCGLFQERAYQDRNWDDSPVPAGEIDALLLTHAHLDHCGLIPKLVRDGFAGPIFCTRPTVELCGVVLRDSAKIQEEDAAYKKKRHGREKRRGKHPEIPLYTSADVEQALPRFRGIPYRKSEEICRGVSLQFHDAGHILGSAMLELRVEHGAPKRLLFSGDIGQWDKPLIRDPTLFQQADYVVMESTYGDRTHADHGDVESQLAEVINATIGRGGNVVIPTFAVERAQELMYYIGRLVHSDRIPDVNVFLDSPMAVDVTDIFKQFRDCFDQQTWELITSNEPPLRFPGLHLARTVQQSKAINKLGSPCIIMASSGMCTAGRIKHHLRQNVERPGSTILFVGYQGHGTLGRQILDGKKRVRIHGQDYRVRAQVGQIYGFSGHADREGLIRWLSHLASPPEQVFLTHGDEEAATSLAKYIRDEMKWSVSVPEYHDLVELSE